MRLALFSLVFAVTGCDYRGEPWLHVGPEHAYKLPPVDMAKDLAYSNSTPSDIYIDEFPTDLAYVDSSIPTQDATPPADLTFVTDLTDTCHDMSAPDTGPDLAQDMSDDDNDDCSCDRPEHGLGRGHCRNGVKDPGKGHGNGHCKFDCR